MLQDSRSVMGWLDSLMDRAPRTRATESLQQALSRNSSAASYASVSEMSRLADLSPAAVTRAAQSWGFAGWPALRLELRSRYLESLSLTEVASERRPHHGGDRVAASLEADRRALISTSTTIDAEVVRSVAAGVAGARNRVALGAGSYKSLADLTAAYFTLAGHPTTSPGDTSDLIGSLADLGEGDLVVGFDLWRGFTSTLQALEIAHEQGAVVCLVTDRGAQHMEGVVDHLLHVSSESSTFFPTLVPAVALIDALTAELAALDPARTDASTTRFEQLWRRTGLGG
jgi:DNA-binding MurR/RpiR family transcriptional regulator